MLSSEDVHCQINFTSCSDMIVHNLHRRSFLLFINSFCDFVIFFTVSVRCVPKMDICKPSGLCSSSLFVRRWCHIWREFCHCLFLISHSFDTLGMLCFVRNFFNIIIYMFSHMPHNATPDQCDAVGTLHFQKQLRKMDTIYRNFLLGLFL